jgi:acyl-CoA synthetase (AMP-forming)/AMP-acid ligase II
MSEPVIRYTDQFDRGASLYPNNLAFVDENHSLTYQESADVTHYIATRLRSVPGIDIGSHFAVYSPNDAYAFLCMLGGYRAEMIYVTVNFRSSLENNINAMNQFDIDFLFYHSQVENNVKQIKEKVPRIKGFVCIDKKGDTGPYLNNWLEGYHHKFEPTSYDPEAIAAIYTTGGTTGKPRGVVHTHRDWTIGLLDSHAFWHMDVGTRHLLAAPMTHAGGVYAMNHCPKGGTNYFIQRVDVERIMSMIQELRITHFFLPPTAIYMMLAHPDVKKYDYSSLIRFISAGAPLPSNRLKEAIEVFGPAMCNVYGETEANSMICCLTSERYLNSDGSINEKRLRTVGIPTLAHQVSIMDDNGTIVGIGQRGEIVLRGPCRMREYYKDPEATEEALKFGWLHTGDIGIKDEEGFISIVDRKKEMIISGGFNVYPSEVEAVILQFPDIEECAVIGVPDEKWGEAVNAVIKLKPNGQVNPKELIAYCKERLGGFQSPKHVEIWDNIPISPVGKVLRREVRSRFL